MSVHKIFFREKSSIISSIFEQSIYNHYQNMLASSIKTFSSIASKSLRTTQINRFLFSKDNTFNNISPSDLSTNHTISTNIGVNKFLGTVYKTTGISFMGALGTSYAVLSIPALASMMIPLSYGGIAATLIGFIGSSFMTPTYKKQTEILNSRQKAEYMISQNTSARKLLYGLGVAGLGLSAAPLLAMASMVSPTIIPTCLGLTGAIFGGASLMAYNMKKDSMLKYGGVLTGSLFGLIGLQIVGLLSSLIVGPNPFSMMLFSASNYVAVGLFSAFIVYDTHVAIKMYETGQPDQIGMATQLLLDVWNIFTSLLRIFSSNN